MLGETTWLASWEESEKPLKGQPEAEDSEDHSLLPRGGTPLTHCKGKRSFLSPLAH